MIEETDASNGSESLSIEQAAAAYVKATTPEPVVKDQGKSAETDDSDTTTDEELQASDEDVSEESDGETAEEDQAENGEDEEPVGKGRFAADDARVKLADGSFATVAELKQGSLRNADYTRKTQEVAEQRKSFEAQSERIKASEQQLEQQREYVASLVKSIIGTPPDPTLADPNSPNYDPAKYQAEEVRFRSWAQHLTYLESEQQRIGNERQAETAKQTKERVEKEWGLALEKLPELKDAKRLEAFGKDTLKYGAEYGYSPQELANIHSDHRNLVVMKKAILWDKLQASKAKVAEKVEGRPPVQRGGKRLSPSEARARGSNDAFNRLKQSGSVDDATAAYLASRK